MVTIKNMLWILLFTAVGIGCAQSGGPQRSSSVGVIPSATPIPSAIEDRATPTTAPPRDVSGLFKKQDGGTAPAVATTMEAKGDDKSDSSAPVQPRGTEWSLVRSVAAVILTLGGLLAVNRFLRRRMRLGATEHEGEAMRVINVLPLDHQRRLLLVAVDGKRALLCSGRDGVTSIATFDPPNVPTSPTPPTDQQFKTTVSGG